MLRGLRTGRLALFIVVVAFAGGCASTSSGTSSPAAPPSATIAPSVTAGPTLAVAEPTPSPAPVPTATPAPTLRTGYDLPPYAELTKLFDYDTTEPVAHTVTYQEQQDGVTVYDIEYPSGGYPVSGKLVFPEGNGPFPVVLYASGYQLSPSFFLPEMVVLAKEGYAGLGIGNRFGTDLYTSIDGKATIEGYRNYVVDLRRALDLLGTLPQIDAKRIGFVGQSLGCAAGSILSGIDARVAAYALMACGGYVTDPAWSYCWDACASATAADRAGYQERLAVLDPVNYIGRGGDAAFLFQASKGDTIARAPNVEALVAAAPEPKRIEWFDYGDLSNGGHGFGCETYGSCDPTLPAFEDHRAWLKENL